MAQQSTRLQDDPGDREKSPRSEKQTPFTDGAFTLREAVAGGLLASALQLALCLWASGHSTLARAYGSFADWDGRWYASIAKNGYRTSLPPVKWQPDISNVAFFPGFPLLGRALSQLTGLDIATSLVIVAQLMAAVFWGLVLICLSRWTRSRAVALIGAFCIFSHPAAFYLQLAYSESLFLSSLLGFILLTTGRQRTLSSTQSLTAAGTGIVLTATRIVGAPLAFLGVFDSLMAIFTDRPTATPRAHGSSELQAGPWHRLRAQLIIAGVSLLGIASFFAFCAFKWGRWDLYLWSQEIGWDIHPNYFVIFTSKPWSNWTLSDWRPAFLNPFELNRVMASLYLVLLSVTALIEAARARADLSGLRTRLPFLIAAGSMMFVSVSGLAGVDYGSMTRYTFPVHVCWLISMVALRDRLTVRLQAFHDVWLTLMILLGLYFGLLQMRFIHMFTNSSWVG